GETYYALESTAHALGIEVLWIQIKQTDDLDRAFAEALAKKVNGLLFHRPRPSPQEAIQGLNAAVEGKKLPLSEPRRPQATSCRNPGMFLRHAGSATMARQRVPDRTEVCR